MCFSVNCKDITFTVPECRIKAWLGISNWHGSVDHSRMHTIQERGIRLVHTVHFLSAESIALQTVPLSSKIRASFFEGQKRTVRLLITMTIAIKIAFEITVIQLQANNTDLKYLFTQTFVIGDRILEINGQSLEGLSRQEVTHVTN